MFDVELCPFPYLVDGIFYSLLTVNSNEAYQVKAGPDNDSKKNHTLNAGSSDNSPSYTRYWLICSKVDTFLGPVNLTKSGILYHGDNTT